MPESFSNIEEGVIVAARAMMEGVEYVVVAVESEVLLDRIRSSQVLRHFADRLFGGLPVVLNARDEDGRERFLGCGLVADLFEESTPALEWHTLYEDGAA